MALSKLSYERDTPVPPRAVQAWFFDLQEDDHTRGDHPGILQAKPGDYRKILKRGDDTVEAEDSFQGGRSKVRYVVRKVGEDTVRYDVTGAMYNSTGMLKAAAKGTGSHITFASDAKWKPFGWILRPFIGKMLEKAILADMAAHVDDMEQDWKAKAW